MKIILVEGKTTWVGRIIDWVTNSKYSHAGIVIGKTFYDASESRGSVGSDHTVKDYQGRGMKVYDLGKTDPRTIAWIKSQVGRDYDYVGIIGWIFNYQRNSNVYCFEWVLEALCMDRYGSPEYGWGSVGANDITHFLEAYHKDAKIKEL